MIYKCCFSPSYVVLYLLKVINLLSSFIRLARSILIDFHSLHYSGSSHSVKVYLISSSYCRALLCTQYSRWGLSWVSHSEITISPLLTVSHLKLHLLSPSSPSLWLCYIVILWSNSLFLSSHVAFSPADGNPVYSRRVCSASVSNPTHYLGLLILILFLFLSLRSHNSQDPTLYRRPFSGCVISAVYLLLPHIVPALFMEILNKIAFETHPEKTLLIASFQLKCFP